MQMRAIFIQELIVLFFYFLEKKFWYFGQMTDS